MYKRNPRPDSNLKKKLSIELNINKSKVARWFTRRRYNEKKQGTFQAANGFRASFFFALTNTENIKTLLAPCNQDNSIVGEKFECTWFVMFSMSWKNARSQNESGYSLLNHYLSCMDTSILDGCKRPTY